MCLSIDSSVVPLFNDEGWGTFYKFVEAEGNISPYFSHKYEPGVLVSTRLYKHLNAGESESNSVAAGVHVLLTLDSIKQLLRDAAYSIDMRIIKILAHQDHLVAAGYWSVSNAAVFTQVTVPDDFELEVVEGVEEEEDDWDDDDLEDEWDDIEEEEDSWDDEEDDFDDEEDDYDDEI